MNHDIRVAVRPRRAWAPGLACAALLVACGAALLTSCAGGALPPAPLFVLVGVIAVGGWLSACGRSLTPPDAHTPSVNDCLGDDDIDRSMPGDTPDPPTGWGHCCLQGQTRLCPSTPGVACNYGLWTTFNPDGTCGFRGPDAGVDVAMDVAPETDAVADALPDGPVGCYSVTVPIDAGVSPGSIVDGGFVVASWAQCCVQNQQRLCYGNTNNAACNYSLMTLCADGTCRLGFGSCEPVDAADANAASP